MGIRRSLIGIVALGSVSCAMGADWPQYAGISRTNVSAETGLLKSWPATGPKVLWTRPLGEGFGGAAIRDGQVFVLDRTGKGPTAKDVLRCLDLTTGSEVWSYSYDAPGATGFNGSRAVPTVTEKAVFCVGPFGQLQCIDRTTHKPVWQTGIVTPGAKMPPWALCQAPLLYQDMVIVSTLGSAGLTAYDQATGKIRWRAAGVPGAAYCSPELVDMGGGQEQVVLTVGDGVVGVDPATGKLLWKYSNWKCGIPIPNVTSLGEGKLFVTGGYKAGSALIQVAGGQVKELWRIPQGAQVHQAIVVDGCIYFNGNANESVKEGITCIDAADGKVLWKSGEEPKLDRGNFIYADGMFYVMDASGSLNLVEPSREAFKIVSSAKLLGGKDIWAPMALSDGRLVLRDQGQMKCVKVSAAK